MLSQLQVSVSYSMCCVNITGEEVGEVYLKKTLSMKDCKGLKYKRCTLFLRNEEVISFTRISRLRIPNDL